MTADLAECLGIVERCALGVGVEDVEIVGLANQHLFAVGGDFESLDVAHHRVGLVAFIGDFEALQRHVLMRIVVGIEPAEALFGGLQAVVVARRDGDFGET